MLPLLRSLATPLLFAAVTVASPTLHGKDSTTHQQDGYTLIFENDDPNLDPRLKARLIETFFKVYPAEAREFNPGSAHTVTFSMDSSYQGIAATMGNSIHFNPTYFHQHPADIDVVTHEAMHVVQSYATYDPGWVVEGIADYARYKYGVDNPGGGWSLPDYQPGQNYKNAYRITARFLVWLEKNGHEGLVKKLDGAMRTNTYKPGFWKENTGKTVDELWQDYGKNPAL